MRRRELGLVALIAVAVLMGCTNADDTPPGPGGNGNPEPPAPAVPAVPPDYIIHVDGSSRSGRDVERPITCIFAGLDATGDVVNVTAQGKTSKFIITVNSTTMVQPPGRRFPLYTQGAPGLAVIKYECALTGGVGDAILCEATTGDGERPAPLLDSVDYGEVEFGRGDVARCYGVINTLA